MVFWNELKKTFSRTTLFILLSVVMLNGILIVSGEKDRGYSFSAEGYKALYDSPEMQGDTEAQLAYLEKLLDGDDFRQYYLARFVKADIEKLLGYEDYLKGIAASAERYGKLSIFKGKDEFAERNIEKTAAVYAALPKIKTEAGKSRGVVMASRYSGSVILAFMFMLYLVFSLVTREKEIGSLNLTMTTKLGHMHHGGSKVLVCFAFSVLISVVLEIENWIIAGCTYGLGDMSRSIQSIPEYQPCVFNISILGFSMVSVLLKTACVIMVSMIVFFISCRSRNLPGLAVRLTVVFGIEGLMYYVLSGNSIWGLIKYINVFAGMDSCDMLGNYLNLNLFGYPAWYLPVYIGFIVIVILLFGVLGLRAYANMQSLPSSRRIKFFALPVKTGSVLKQECYRYFICEHAVLMLIVFAVMRALTFSQVKESFAFQEDIYYKQYMLKLEGRYSEDKEKEIDAEDALYAEITAKANEASAAASDESIRSLIWMKYKDETDHFKVLYKVRDQAQYLKEKDGAFLYDQGYRILSGEDSGKEQNMLLGLMAGIMMVVCSVFMYGPDYQAGTDRMIRATKRGRAYLFARRELIGSAALLIVFAVTYIPYTLSVLGAYGSQGLDFPACSVRCLSAYPHWVTLKLYLIGLNAVRFIVLWAGMNTLWYVSAKVRSMSYTFGIGLGMCVVYLFS